MRRCLWQPFEMQLPTACRGSNFMVQRVTGLERNFISFDIILSLNSYIGDDFVFWKVFKLSDLDCFFCWGLVLITVVKKPGTTQATKCHKLTDTRQELLHVVDFKDRRWPMSTNILTKSPRASHPFQALTPSGLQGLKHWPASTTQSTKWRIGKLMVVGGRTRYFANRLIKVIDVWQKVSLRQAPGLKHFLLGRAPPVSKQS